MYIKNFLNYLNKSKVKNQINQTIEQLLVFIILVVFTVAFFKTDSGTMWAVGLLFFCLSFRTLMFFLNNLVSIYIDIKFLGKTLR